jgi:phosphocarrier protein HPr
MPQRTAVVASTSGLHARPASVFVEAASALPMAVTVAKGDGPAVDATSILMVMTLGAEHGAEVVLTAEGEGAEEALEALVAVVETNHDAVA